MSAAESGGAAKAAAGGEEVVPATSDGPFEWTPPESWGDAGRAAVLAKHEGKEISSDYLPPTDEELEIIKSVVKGVADVPAAKTELDDMTLLRFVRGFTLNQWAKLPVEEAVEKTVEVLKLALEFYQHVGASTILDRQVSRSYEYHKYWVNGVVGTDTFGRQIYLVHPPGSRLIKQFKGHEDLLLNHVYDLQKLARMKREEEQKRGNGLLLYKHVMILDGGQTSLTMERLMFMKNALDYKDHSIDSDFYPEMLYRAWIINAPLALRALWKMAAPFLNPITRAKFVIVGDVPLQKMEEDGLTLDNLPEYLGGNAANPPGFHYRETVKAGKTFERVWPVKKGDSIFWDMEMKSSYYMDITVSCNGTEVQAARIDEEKGDMFTGTHVADADGEFQVAMHNDGRWHSRTVSYDVRINESQ
eukprot:INCI18601.1.p2 GENE.INCI18601.1~~INCI18601.1.p2  ORF type:complete len:416 (-),score=89.60 INCI18601.1:2332-3579(-)